MCLVGNYFSCFLIAVGFQSEEKQLENFKDKIRNERVPLLQPRCTQKELRVLLIT